MDTARRRVYAGCMEYTSRPALESPNVIAAFTGWNDAGQAATTAVRWLIDHWSAQPFASMDPEDYYSFTDTRPTIRIVEGSTREMQFPQSQFFAYAGSAPTPAAVLMVAAEPNLKWRTYCREVIALARDLGAQRIVTLGSLITDAVHTRPVPLTGWATEDPVRDKLVARSITRSNYEGPTGIVGTLHSFCLEADMPTASMWAASPYYLGATPNPKSALGLLDALDDALNLSLDLSDLRGVAGEFERQVTLAVRDNEEVRDQITRLEERYDAQAQESEQERPPQFPPTGRIIADLEQFLRTQRREDDD